jgi:hypothetical protein
MTDPLPPFSGDNPTCPKCAHTDAYTEYKPDGTPGTGSGSWEAGFPERLERRCARCDYTWDEAINPPSSPAATETDSPAQPGIPKEPKVVRIDRAALGLPEREQPPAAWMPPPPGDQREQLPDERP